MLILSIGVTAMIVITMTITITVRVTRQPSSFQVATPPRVRTSALGNLL